MAKRIGIKADGLNYVFTPGKGGSLIGRKLVKSVPSKIAVPKIKAKVIGPKEGLEDAFKPATVAGSRG